jgi:DNA-binding transcriptional MerR regulator
MTLGMTSGAWKVGELAKMTGTTIRALHHYDEIGLLRPSHHTDSGHRLYTRQDLERLQHILALKRLGFPLERIHDALRRPDFSPAETIAALRAQLRRQSLELESLDRRLAEVERILASGGEVSTERLIQIVEGLVMYEKYLDKEQLAEIHAHSGALGPDRLRETTEREWPSLVAALKAEADCGTDPSAPQVQALACRWVELTQAFTGTDPGIAAKLLDLYERDSIAFAKDKAGAYGPQAVDDLAGCVRYLAKALRVRARTPAPEGNG